MYTHIYSYWREGEGKREGGGERMGEREREKEVGGGGDSTEVQASYQRHGILLCNMVDTYVHFSAL